MIGAHLPAALATAAALAVAWHLHRRLRAAAAAAAECGRRLAERDRALGLLAREIEAAGLALLGHADASAAGQAPVLAARARDLLRLSDDLSAMIAAARTGPPVLRPETVRLLPLLEAAVATVAGQLGPGRRQWRLAPEFGSITLVADPRALQGAVERVLVRAARMTRDGDWIDLRPVLTPESLAIVVEDEGAGLAVEDLAAGAAEGARSRGLCFGLAVARSLLEAHGGGLRLEAVKDVGTRAWLTLPREPMPAAA